MKKTTLWGVELTSIEDTLFMKWLNDNPNIKRPNTISHEERVELLTNWLNDYRAKAIA